MFTPPSLRDTLEPAGNSGGSNWGAAAVDPTTGFLYERSKDEPTMLKLETKPPKRPLSGPPATQGHIIYIQNCQMCHTAALTGQPPEIPSLIDIVSRIGPDQVRTTVENGLSPMPAFPDLTSKDLDSLIAYLSAPETGTIPADVLARLNAPPVIPKASFTNDNVRYWSGYGYMVAPDGLPDITPPWTTITAYDLNSGKIMWQVPDGGVTRLEAKGIKNTGGIDPVGGIAVTAGGLIFSGMGSDSTIRAYDKDTGKVLWENKLPADPNGTPAVYEIDGREYVVLSADASHLPRGVKPAPGENTQGYYVFALPKGGAGK
jgi:quinoprotein glucose dehydrogenase